MKHISKISPCALFAILTVAIISCKTTKDTTNTLVTVVDFGEVASGILTGGGDEGIKESFIVIDSQSELDSVKMLMNKVNPSTSELDKQTFDFKKDIVIAYFQPVKSTGGYTLSARSIESQASEGKTVYTVNYILKTPQGNATSALTQPYVFIKTRKMKGKIEYTVTEEPQL